MSAKTVLFLCSGNYYRSRFAEILFNWLAQQNDIPHTAVSRGFRLNEKNIGPISIHAVAGLAQRSVPMKAADQQRHPLVVSVADLEIAQTVVALNETEHRPWIERQFPAWVDRVQYWQIDDIHLEQPDSALRRLEEMVRSLVAQLNHTEN